MFDGFISWLGTTFFTIVIFGVLLSGFMGATKWYQLQSETQFIADTVAQYGCYTQETDSNLRDFLKTKNFPNTPSVSIEIDTGNSSQAIYGQQVVVKITYPWYAFVDMKPLEWDLGTYASAVSTYEPSASAAYRATNQVCTVPNF